ncbi:unnamed protein product [Lampetra planeri]
MSPTLGFDVRLTRLAPELKKIKGRTRRKYTNKGSARSRGPEPAVPTRAEAGRRRSRPYCHRTPSPSAEIAEWIPAHEASRGCFCRRRSRVRLFDERWSASRAGHDHRSY